MSERYLWRGFLMCAVRGETDGSRVIHLQDAYGGTLCGSHKSEQVIDHEASTGWPDCNACIKEAERAGHQHV